MDRVNRKQETASYVSAVDWDEDVKYDYVMGFKEYQNSNSI